MTPVIYIRISTRKQEEAGSSAEAQLSICQNMVEADGLDVKRMIVLKDAASGKSKKNRADYAKLLQLIAEGNVRVYSYKMSRLGRSLKDILELYELAEKHNVDIKCHTGNIDLPGPLGRLMRTILASFNQFEREVISENTADNLRNRKQNGLVYSPPKFGYTVEGRVVEDGKVLSPGRNVPCETEMGLVHIMNVLYNETGLSLEKIAGRLNSYGAKPKRARQWTFSLVRKAMISHGVYSA
jgi:DNA invertase Pin-like site-specific DNA recombinase